MKKVYENENYRLYVNGFGHGVLIRNIDGKKVRQIYKEQISKWSLENMYTKEMFCNEYHEHGKLFCERYFPDPLRKRLATETYFVKRGKFYEVKARAI